VDTGFVNLCFYFCIRIGTNGFEAEQTGQKKRKFISTAPSEQPKKAKARKQKEDPASGDDEGFDDDGAPADTTDKRQKR